MEQPAKLSLTAGILMLLAGGIFGFLRQRIIAGSIVAGIAAGLMQAEPASGMAQNFDSSGSIVLGIMLLLGSLLCRYGAELRGNTEPDEI